MKVVPKLSHEQLCMLERLRRSEQQPTQKRPAPQASSKPVSSGRPANRTFFAVADRVEIVRDVVDTAYRTGQRGAITALHGIPAKIAEVEIDGSTYSDVVRLQDLRNIG